MPGGPGGGMGGMTEEVEDTGQSMTRCQSTALVSRWHLSVDDTLAAPWRASAKAGQ